MILRKSDIAAMVSEKTGLTKKDSAEAVNAIIDSILESIAKDEVVNITGFGTFKTDDRSEREVRNPATGGVVKIPAHKHPKFAFSESIRTAFRDGEQSKYLK